MHNPNHPNPYGSPHQNIQAKRKRGPAPPVVIWYRVYCGFMVFLYLVLVGLGIFLFVAGLSGNLGGDSPEDEFALTLMGAIYGLLGFVFALLHGLAAFFCRGNGGWIFGIVVIALGLTSCLTWPFTIPLLIFWLKAENKSRIVG